ncbi:UDP-glucoronosyl and UDP-glucosyl transferase domain-containing protein [Ditylenchus destructor]|nr:UDP-glucoronosyl and UDP-glucosyl transferase domain-containing protein [Ditylenchus destructor]KAI1731457.1 UDP-glucoronosyl and UDP-glucosyl transferase domain-containing protein [Ditylenchus destructor]
MIQGYIKNVCSGMNICGSVLFFYMLRGIHAKNIILFNHRVCQTLANAGHDVTIIRVSVYETYFPALATPKGVKDLLQNKEFIEWLRRERFDLAFTHMFEACPIGLIHHVKIPSWVWLNSGPLLDFVASSVGVPLPPSYVPPMLMAVKDSMTFTERLKSFVGHGLLSILYPRHDFIIENF